MMGTLGGDLGGLIAAWWYVRNSDIEWLERRRRDCLLFIWGCCEARTRAVTSIVFVLFREMWE